MKHSAGYFRLVEDAKKRVKEVTVKEVKERLGRGGDFLFVDVREEHEWNTAHAAGAIFMSKGIIERDIEKKVPDKKTELILYCGGGYRSALVADNLQKMGYRNVLSMAGGWKAWKKARGKVSQF